MTKPVTIDNLGIDPSQRYARDIAETDTEFFRDSANVSRQISVTATTSYLSDFEELFGTWIKTPSWANFAPPPNFSSHAKNIFTFQIAPSLGSPEEIENEIQTLENKKFKKGRRKKQEKESQQEQQQEEQSEEEESKKILSMLQSIQRFDKILELINSRKGEFQKG